MCPSALTIMGTWASTVKSKEILMRRVWLWRHAGLLAGGGILLQTTGCPLDQTTVDALVTVLVQVIVQALLGSTTGTFTTV